jgi:E3 ubiquitin-protein ligase BRE1
MFQKDAIYRQMQEYKREKHTLESQLKETLKQSRYHNDHITAIDSWFRQLIDEVKVMAGADEDQDMQLESLPSSLLFSDQSEFVQHLSQRTDDIRSIMSRLFGRARSFTPEAVHLQKRLSLLLAVEKEHSAELERLRQEKDDLESRLENASLRYMRAERKVDRNKSKTLEKMDSFLHGESAATKKEDPALKKEESTTNGVTDSTEELAEMELKFNQVSALSEKLKEQLEKLQEENAKLNTQVTESASKFAALTDDDYAKTELFKQAKLQMEENIKKLNDLEARHTVLTQENQKFQSERTVFENQLEAECRAVITEKDQQIGQIDTNLIRIRAERDNLLAELSIKKASIDQDKESTKKMKDLNSALEERIKSLESELERCKAANEMSVDDAELDSLSAEELKTKFQSLNQRYNLLNGELASMSSAFQKTSKLASQKVTDLQHLEEKVQRLSAEKAKADQKYFAAMKSKETREGEVRALKMQSSKTSEVVAQLKDSELAARTLLSNLERQVAEHQAAHSSKANEQRDLAQKKALQESDITRLSSQIAEFRQQLTAKDAQVTTASDACRKAEAEVVQLQTALTDTRRSLETWKSKSGSSEQYEALRHLTYCNVCRKNLKNTVIKTCGHLFCSDCVDKVVSNRSRKCPTCGKSFGSNDYMAVTL